MTVNPKEELKNCPFCDAEISDEFNEDKNEATHLIGMTNCFLTGVILEKEQWNKRTGGRND